MCPHRTCVTRRRGCLFSLPGPGIVHDMRFARDSLAGNTIRAYAAGQITVNEEIVRVSVVVTPERLIRNWLPETFEELRQEHIARLEELQPEIIVLGTGGRLQFPAAEFTVGFLSRGIGVEIMDTNAACRTYNIVQSEGRRVVAALLIA